MKTLFSRLTLAIASIAVFTLPARLNAGLVYLNYSIQSSALDFTGGQVRGYGVNASYNSVLPSLPITDSSTAVSPDAGTSVETATITVTQSGGTTTIDLHHVETLGASGGNAYEQYQIAFAVSDPASYLLTSTWTTNAYQAVASNNFIDISYPGGFYTTLDTDNSVPFNHAGISGPFSLQTFDGDLYYLTGFFSMSGFGPSSGEGDLIVNIGPASAVPEPSTFVLLGFGGIGIAIATYRRLRAIPMS